MSYSEFCLLTDMQFDSATHTESDFTGLDCWMDRVLQECDKARRDFAPEPVHDLRVALRRCRSIADGFIAFDPHLVWKQMKGEGRQLFRQLGALRDTQVMIGWVQRFASAEDQTAAVLNRHLVNQEFQFKESAAEALQAFNRKKWASWTKLLSKRARRIPVEGMAFQHLALERWSEARDLHRQALRNRSHTSYHRLRIGLKKFRYIVENFLPARHNDWGADLRECQNLLGEMHDLHVLWQMALAIKAFASEENRVEWRQRISGEWLQRLERYRQVMMGKSSLWHVWRSDLPDSDRLKSAAMARLRAWASFRDPDFAHSEHVSKLALQIYDGLDSLGLISRFKLPDAPFFLEAAALMHDVGKMKADKKHQRASCRMIQKIVPSPGLDAGNLRDIALIARFHRGALPRSSKKPFSGISFERAKSIILLSGILRLANAFDAPHQKQIRRLALTKSVESIRINAAGYSESDATAKTLAAARHLLETACGMPIIIGQF